MFNPFKKEPETYEFTVTEVDTSDNTTDIIYCGTLLIITVLGFGMLFFGTKTMSEL